MSKVNVKIDTEKDGVHLVINSVGKIAYMTFENSKYEPITVYEQGGSVHETEDGMDTEKVKQAISILKEEIGKANFYIES